MRNPMLMKRKLDIFDIIGGGAILELELVVVKRAQFYGKVHLGEFEC